MKIPWSTLDYCACCVVNGDYGDYCVDDVDDADDVPVPVLVVRVGWGYTPVQIHLHSHRHSHRNGVVGAYPACSPTGHAPSAWPHTRLVSLVGPRTRVHC